MAVVNRTSIYLFEDVADSNFLEKPINIHFSPTHVRVSNMIYTQTAGAPPTNPETLIKVSYSGVNNQDAGIGIITDGAVLQNRELLLKCSPAISGIQRFDFSSNLNGKVCFLLEYLQLE